MIVYEHKMSHGIKNFGDEMNSFLWPRLCPEVSEKREDWLFVGIGTILSDKLPRDKMKIIFGSGAGYGNYPIVDAAWDIYCVRGPLTAKALNLSADLAITDSAILVHKIDEEKVVRKKYKAAFMPHALSSFYAGKIWQEICNDLNIQYIDPQGAVNDVLSSIKACKMLITEAMHGAIIADLYRIPWVPVSSSEDILEFKWVDWCSSMNLQYQPMRILSLWPNKDSSLLSKIKAGFKKILIQDQLKQALKKAKRNLSDEKILATRLSQLDEKLTRLKSRLCAK